MQKPITLPSGETVSNIGLGTWRMGENPRSREQEVKALRAGLELGINLIDTAEMYGEGGAEKIIAEAIDGHRDDVLLVSKVYPHNASRKGAIKACERSLQRLRTDRIDLYLLHWRGQIPLSETLEAFQQLVAAGKIRHFGVSNFDKDDMDEWYALDGGEKTASNQLIYNLNRRGIEWDLLSWCTDRGIPVMAYSPLDQGALNNHAALKKIANRYDVTSLQIALAWVLHQDNVIVIPKAANLKHVEQNRAALDIELDQADLAELDRVFPPPGSAQPLDIL
ncbi:MAG: aldo/keto reductase [Gammaproteobacteria bacterium]|nr:aldo/keto reductase [Gammaproteobacteria bacterium]